MSLLRRFLSKFQPAPPASQFSDLEADELISNLEALVRKAVKSYSPPTSKAPNYPQAEFAAFIYFWLRTWSDQQPEAIRDYGPINKLILRWAQDGCPPVKIFHSLNYSRGWDPDRWFSDRVRLYQSIVTNEPQDGSPPSIFVACHLLTVLCDSNRSLEELPDIGTSAEILGVCLSKNIFGDAIEQLNLFTHATEMMTTILPEITDILTELHIRRLSN